MEPYEPKGTFLGAPTKHVADDRSIETLVDFARGNLGWIRDLDPEQTQINLKRKRDSIATSNGEAREGGPVPIDPALGGGQQSGSFTVVNGSNTSFANMEGRFIPASIGGVEDNSNDVSPQITPIPNEQRPMEPGAHVEEGERCVQAEARDGEAREGTAESFHQPSTMLPSPSAMLTGALPNSHTKSTEDTNNNYYNLPNSSNIVTTPTRDTEPSPTRYGFLTNTQISGLEQNPLAFIAAAGLSQLNSSPRTHQAPVAPMLFINIPPEFSNQPEMFQQPPVQEPPPKARAPLPRRKRIKSAIHFASPTEVKNLDFVKKAKDATRRTKNLLHGKRKSLPITLRLPQEHYALMQQIEEADLVTSDLKSGVIFRPARPPSPFDTFRPSESSPPKRDRGRPRKKDIDSYDVSSDSDSFNGPTISSETIARRNERRAAAYARRQQEEAEVREEFLEKAVNTPYDKKGGHNRIGVKEVTSVLRERTPPPPPPPPPPEDTPTRLAREATEAEEERLAAEARAKAKAEAEAAAAELRARKAEEKEIRRRQRHRLRHEEAERRRRDADKNAKLVAAGIMVSSDLEEVMTSDISGFKSSEESEPEPEPEPEREAEEFQMRILGSEPPDGPMQLDIDFDRFLSPTPSPQVRDRPFYVLVPSSPSNPNWRDAYQVIKKRPRGRPRKSLDNTPGPKKTPGSQQRGRKKDPDDDDVVFKSWIKRRDVPPVTSQREKRETKRQSVTYVKPEEDQALFESPPPPERNVTVRKVEIAPGKWGVVEISDEEMDDAPDVAEDQGKRPPMNEEDMDMNDIGAGDRDGDGGEDNEYMARWVRKREWY